MAADGVGIYGRTNDKVVTFFAFGLIAFFAIFVTVLSLIQIRLDNRKERRDEGPRTPRKSLAPALYGAGPGRRTRRCRDRTRSRVTTGTAASIPAT